MSMVSTHFWSRTWHSLLYGGGGKRTVESHVFVINAYTLLAFASVTVFGLLHIWEGNTFVGQLELAGGTAIGLNAIGLRIRHNVAAARTYLLLTIMVLLFVMLMTGGTGGTGIFWFFMFPVVAFFLAGKRQGLWWMAGLYVMLLAVVGLTKAGVLELAYSLLTVRQLAVTLGIVAIGLYVYQQARERAVQETLGIDQAKSDFVALASHQLRTPISAISWFAEMLLNGDAGKLTREQHKDIEQIYQSNQRMAALINDMLIVSSLDLGNLPVRATPSSVAELVRAELKDLRDDLLAGRMLAIQEDYAKNLPKVAIDPDIMRTVLRNLISNAIKYTPDGGKITIRLATATSNQANGKDYLRLEIQDSGVGIPEPAQKKIFTKFYRAENIRERDTDGTGLGLYIVKMLLAYVGGTVSFTSTENVGSVFTVMLPLDGMKRSQDKP